MATIYDKNGTQVYDSNGQTFNAKTGTVYDPNTAITSSSIANTGSSLNLPDLPKTSNQELVGAIPTVDSILGQNGQGNVSEQTQIDLRRELLNTVNTLSGKNEATIQAENAAGLPEQNKQLQEYANRLTSLRNESLAIPLQIQEQFTGTGATVGGAEPIQTSKLRQNAIQALSVSAQAQALQGNIALARQQIDRSIQLQFEPEERKLAFLQQAYQFNREDLERTDKRRAENLKIQLDERARLIQDQKEERRGIENIMATVASFGGSQDVVNAIRNERTVQGAIAVASPYMVDPKAKAALEGAYLSNQLARIKIQQAREELDVFRKYGGLTPQQWAAQKEEEKKARIAAGEKTDKAKETNRELDAQEKQVNAILNSAGLSTIVGPNILSRGTLRQKGLFSSLVSAGASALSLGGTTGAIPEITGSADDVVNLTEQLLSKQFLDTLIDVKGQGATFGALTDREGNALRTAANAIAGSKIEKDGRVIGYDMSETEFKRQMGIVLGAIKYAREQNTGTVFTQDELDTLNNIQQATSTINFNPRY